VRGRRGWCVSPLRVARLHKVCSRRSVLYARVTHGRCGRPCCKQAGHADSRITRRSARWTERRFTAAGWRCRWGSAYAWAWAARHAAKVRRIAVRPFSLPAAAPPHAAPDIPVHPACCTPAFVAYSGQRQPSTNYGRAAEPPPAGTLTPRRLKLLQADFSVHTGAAESALYNGTWATWLHPSWDLPTSCVFWLW
jgi:hypothetical protein